MVRTPNGYAPKEGYFRAELNTVLSMHAEEMPDWELYEMSPLLDSSDMTVFEWNRIAKIIEENYTLYDGFVVLHGTDTMAYAGEPEQACGTHRFADPALRGQK